MLKWKLRACAKCGGDMYIDRDMDGWFEQCLQCSHRHELRELQYRKVPVAVAVKPNGWDSDED